MPTVAEAINKIYQKAGVDTTDLKDLLANPELTKINISDDSFRKVNENLMTEEMAKVNSRLKSYFRNDTLSPIDKELHEKVIPEYEIEDADALEIRNNPNTYEKIQTAMKAVKKALEKKSTLASGEKKSLVEKITELNGEIVKIQSKHKAEVDNLNSTHAKQTLDYHVRSVLGGYTYSDQFERADAIELAILGLNRSLTNDNAKVVLNADGTLALVQANDPSLPFTKEHQKVNFKDYADKIVADKKLIKTNSGAPGAPNPAPLPTPVPGAKQYIPPVKALSDIDKALEDAGITKNGQVVVQ